MSVQQQQPPPPPSSSYDGYPANNINGQPQSGANGPLAPYSQPGTYPFPGGYPPPPLPPGLQPPTQPPQPVWMPLPQSVPNCPPGLEYLTLIDQLLIKQKKEIFEILSGYETNNKYVVQNSMGQQVYYAVEDTDFCIRYCYGPMRPFDLKILDNSQREVIHMNRPFACSGCCCPCCLQSIDIFAPPGQFVGRVKQDWSLCAPSFSILNEANEKVLKIKGPYCICGEAEFKIMALDEETQVGKILKQWSGLMKEYMTDADNFGITFPMDLDVKMKAVMMGACFLIDFMYFEQNQNQSGYHGRY